MVVADDIARMRAHLFFEGADVRARQSRFWLLLVLAAIIATAGVGGDSTATVIGAMIVAPLMTPILGIVLAMVLNDRRNLLRSIAIVVAGACVVVALGYLIGLAIPEPVTAATNSQVASRVSPRLVDLLAALATGAVGSVALVRSDISDTLPGVAIAISLVPPLSVVGLTLESGVYDEARGALLLFLANVSAILATGVVVMALYGLLSAAPARTRARRWSRPGVLVVAALLIVIAVPLTVSSLRIARSTSEQDSVSRVVTQWATGNGWSLASVTSGADDYTARVLGPLPAPSTDQLRAALTAAGLGNVVVSVELIPEDRVVLGPGG
jgi:uncharacterized hydrophobic protein (TIGR00271 family)